MNLVLVGKPEFAGKIAESISNSLFIEINERIFPDGEICPRLLISKDFDFTDAHVIVAMQIDANQSKNDYIISLLLILYNIKQYNPAVMTCIMPYHAYSRQDRVSRLGEPISIKFLAQMLESAGVANFLTVNSHIYGKSELYEYFQKADVIHLSAIPIIAEKIVTYVTSPDAVVCLAPDEGAILLAKEAASALKTPSYGAIHKERDPNTGNITQSLVGESIEVQGRPVLIIDDLVSSGSTMIGAAKIARENGASTIFFGYIHPVHTPENFKNLQAIEPRLIVSTNTIKTQIDGLLTVSIVPLIVNWIQEDTKRNNS